jgi:hypothetical protein
MQRALWLALLVLAHSLAPRIAIAADRAEDIAKQYADAMAAEDWGRALALVRPADLKMVAGTLRDVLVHPIYGKNVRAELGTFTKEPQVMSDAEIAGQVFTSAYAKYRERGILGADKLKISLLGSVSEDANTVHFVQKSELTARDKPLQKISLVSVVRDAGRWYIVFPEELRNQAESFAEQLKEASEHSAEMAPKP